MSVPTRLGRYEIIRRLGKSMTDVYLAHDVHADRKVALKLIPLAGDATSRLVLEAERRGAEIQKRLLDVDRRMIEIYEFGELDGYFFVAMQYVEGRSLADLLSSNRVIEASRAAVIALEICEQLAKFHAADPAVVHGDIKPSNVHVGFNDTVRLLDFGIAKTLRDDRDATGHRFGSPSYCSPERLSRSKVDEQSDLWALGATLYEMLAGVPPYQAEDTRRLERLIRSKRAPRALGRTCPRGLRAIVGKALAGNPAQRYSSAAEFQTDLHLFLGGKQTAAEREQRWKWNPTATIESARAALANITRTARQQVQPTQVVEVMGYVAITIVAFLGGAAGWQAWQARANAAPPRPSATATANDGLASSYVAMAERVLEGYRTSADPWLYEFDWYKAEICLERAIALGSGEDRTIGKLALARGYATLERLEGAQYAERAASRLRGRAREEFLIAARKLPSDAAPRLALARVYVYSLPDPQKAMSEFAAAEKLGATLGRREVEQQGDVHRIAAQQELAANPRKAVALAARARAYYSRVRGYNEVDDHLRQLERIRMPAPRKPRPPRRMFAWR